MAPARLCGLKPERLARDDFAARDLIESRAVRRLARPPESVKQESRSIERVEPEAASRILERPAPGHPEIPGGLVRRRPIQTIRVFLSLRRPDAITESVVQRLPVDASVRFLAMRPRLLPQLLSVGFQPADFAVGLRNDRMVGVPRSGLHASGALAGIRRVYFQIHSVNLPCDFAVGGVRRAPRLLPFLSRFPVYPDERVPQPVPPEQLVHARPRKRIGERGPALFGIDENRAALICAGRLPRFHLARLPGAGGEFPDG